MAEDPEGPRLDLLKYVYSMHLLEPAITPETADREISTALAAYFARYPKYPYNASQPAVREFHRMCDHFGWFLSHPDRRIARFRFTDVMLDCFALSSNSDAVEAIIWADNCYSADNYLEPYERLGSLIGCVLDMIELVPSLESDREVVEELTEVLKEDLELFPLGTVIMGINKSEWARAVWNFVLGELLEKDFPDLGIHSRIVRARETDRRLSVGTIDAA